MRRVRLGAVAGTSVVALSTAVSATVTIDGVPVGNAGNASDPTTGFGAVSHSFRIGKHEVTNSQYAEFLNAVDPGGTNPHQLYNPFMSNYPGFVARTGGIDFTATNSGGKKYTVKTGQADKPVVWVSWLDAARMANWMHNGQGSGSTESGSYQLFPNGGIRSANASIVIPTENEWYKAAYHQPASTGGDADSYWLWATATNTMPSGDAPPGGPNSTNTFGSNGYAATQSMALDPSQTYLTDVGAYTTSRSYYGTFDQGGNTREWNETLIFGEYRGIRGGTWNYATYLQGADQREYDNASREYWEIGFRFAVVPEPTTLAPATAFMLTWARRSKPAI